MINIRRQKEKTEVEEKPCGSMASLLGGGRSTWHHNVFAHNGSRNLNTLCDHGRFAELCNLVRSS